MKEHAKGKTLQGIACLSLYLVCLLAVVACASATPTVSSVTRTLAIAGPPDILPLVQEIALAFANTRPGLTIDAHSSTGAEALSELSLGTVDVAIVHILPSASSNWQTVEIARQPITVIVHPDNPVRNLSLDDLSGIYAGRITEWDLVGGDKAPIMVLSRESTAPVRSHMDTALLGTGSRLMPNALILPSDLAMIATVARRPEAIGYIETINPPAGVKVVSLHNEFPSSVRSGRPYPLWQPVILVTHWQPSPDVNAFLTYVKGKQGQRLVIAWGCGLGGDMQ